MKRLLLSSIAATCVSFTAALAGGSPVVVELYTSQGCSSCPPADAIFSQLAGRDDVIPIALHVDYWDYIGWKDTFGHPAHADRQRAYAAAGQRRTIYTPEMVVNGQTDIVGAKDAAASLETTIAKHAAMKSPVLLEVERVGAKLHIAATSSAPSAMTVQMLRLIPAATQVIKRGENHGKTIEYTNIAQDWTVLESWDGNVDLALDVEVSGDAPVVVLIQAAKSGPILAAARLN